MPGSSEPADLVFETHGVGPMKDTPVAHNSFTSPLQESMSRETVTLVPVDTRVGREQIPKVIVVPQRKRQHMIHIEIPAECPTCPDTFLRVKVPVGPPGIVDITFVYGRAQ